MKPAQNTQRRSGLVSKKACKAKRSKITELQNELFNEGVVSRSLLDAVPNPLLIINEHWQVIYANPAVRTLVHRKADSVVTGFAEGEAFHCVHGRRGLQEAGKHECCRICGVARLLSLSLKGEANSEDCHLDCELTGTAANLDLRVWATPLEFHGDKYSILSLVDISDKKRRAMLENVCFHDLLNTLTSIKGFLNIMKEDEVEDRHEICELLEQTTQSSIDEIMAIRLLERVEQNDLRVQEESMESLTFLLMMIKTLQRHPASVGKRVKMAGSDSCQFITDPRLLRRIINNMLLNALEATDEGGTVTIGCELDEGIRYWVHNDRAISQEVRHQVFQRMSSAKGHGRGVGTYSIKLLSEILGGSASFTSNDREGTTFCLHLPADGHQSEAI